MNDPIVDEVRRVRGDHAARFNYDLWAIFRDIKEQQKRSGLTFVSFADEPSGAAPDQTRQPTGEAVKPFRLLGIQIRWGRPLRVSFR